MRSGLDDASWAVVEASFCPSRASLVSCWSARCVVVSCLYMWSFGDCLDAYYRLLWLQDLLLLLLLLLLLPGDFVP